MMSSRSQFLKTLWGNAVRPPALFPCFRVDFTLVNSLTVNEHLPVPDLKEDPDPEYDPREQDLAERTLKKKLGSNFDPNFMSISSPVSVNLSIQDTQSRQPGQMPNEIKKLDISETPYGRRAPLSRPSRLNRMELLGEQSNPFKFSLAYNC
ncbi:hypothetical protein SKAU_G00286180 [Synaphobranchus kaupii]|uniref:Uncharacterized protein n=1 Tax=Synaphobranchus kaupii TaxID=118154 RepID=A0A9Q1EY45_SYNKA|nr:hypothetical protein SKAU_G00286180 [Synaphobranchus kaupii]